MADPDLSLIGKNVQALQADIRAVKRDLAMLRAQQGEIPTVAQFQAGLTALDERTTELVGALTKQLEETRQELAKTHQETMAAIQDLTTLVRSLRAGG